MGEWRWEEDDVGVMPCEGEGWNVIVSVYGVADRGEGGVRTKCDAAYEH
jgi:hypothetical protein